MVSIRSRSMTSDDIWETIRGTNPFSLLSISSLRTNSGLIYTHTKLRGVSNADLVFFFFDWVDARVLEFVRFGCGSTDLGNLILSLL